MALKLREQSYNTVTSHNVTDVPADADLLLTPLSVMSLSPVRPFRGRRLPVKSPS